MAKSRANSIGVWIILGLLFVGLAGFSVTNFGGNIQSIGKVGNTEIPTQTYFRQLQNELRQISAQAGRNVSFTEAQSFGLDRTVLGQIVAQTALADETKDLRISVGDAEVSTQITAISAFQGVDGNFDREAYAFTLEQSGLSVAEFEEQIRSETARQILTTAITSGARAPAGFTDLLFNWARETRDITWARLDAEDLAEPLPEPTEGALQAYYDENIREFTVAEERAITYVWLTPDMVTDSVTLDDEILRSIYNARINQYVQPERRLVERLVYGNADAAAEARARFDVGEASFEDLVADRGLNLADADLGDVTVGDLGAAGEAVFAMDEPGVIGPLESPLGPALFRMNGILSATEVPFEDAREDLAAEYALDEAARIIDGEFDAIEDLLAGGATLEEVAAETDMQLGQIDWRADLSEGIGAFPAFREAATLVQESDFPELASFDEGGLFALRLDEVRPPRPEPLADVRDRVVAGWEARETTARLMSQALGLADQLRAGREMAALRLDLNTDRGISRDGFLEGTPPGLVSGVFEMTPGEVRVFEDAAGAVLVRLDTVTAPDPDALESQIIKQSFAQQTENDIANDLLNSFSRIVQTEAGIEINSAALTAIHTQLQ